MKFWSFTISPPQPWNEIKLVPLFNNYSEVYIRGDNVINGYIDKTKAKDSEGWLATGDLGEWNENGTLKIIDRKRDLIQLKCGDYVAKGFIL